MSYELPGYDRWLTNAPEPRDLHEDVPCLNCEGQDGKIEDDDGNMIDCEDCGGCGFIDAECEGDHDSCPYCPRCRCRLCYYDDDQWTLHR
jgi:hypothetical protein